MNRPPTACVRFGVVGMLAVTSAMGSAWGHEGGAAPAVVVPVEGGPAPPPRGRAIAGEASLDSASEALPRAGLEPLDAGSERAPMASPEASAAVGSSAEGGTLAGDPDAAWISDAGLDADAGDLSAGDAAADVLLEDAGDAAAVEPAVPEPPAVAPIPAVTETRPAPLPEARRPKLAVQAIVGLLALLALAYVGNHPRVRRVEDALGLQSAITAGFPFIALGMIARHPAVGVLTDPILLGLAPLVDFGLGWLGFLVGFRFDLRRFERMPAGAAVVIGLAIALPFAAIALACAGALMAMGFAGQDGIVLRSAILLGTAGAMSAPPVLRWALRKNDEEANGFQYVDEIIGVAGLALIAAYFRPADIEARWALPGTGWLFVTLGMGATLGSFLYVILRRPATQPEFMAIALGSVGFAAGMAAYLRLSPLVICFVAGTVIANLPGPHRSALRGTLLRLERPIFLVFLALAGALWDPRDWRGWALMPVFLVSRYAGLILGRALARQREPAAVEQLRPDSPAVAPLSIVAIAVVINVSSLYRGAAIPVLITAVIAGALAAEVIAALFGPKQQLSPGGDHS